MPKNPSHNFSSQFKSIFRISSEFCTFSDKRNLIKISLISKLKNCFFLGSIFSNKIFLFIKIKHQLVLFQLFKFKNEIISDLTISEKLNNIVYFTQKNNIFLYTNQKKEKQKKINKYKRVLFIKNYNRNWGQIRAVKFCKKEKYLVLFFMNGKIEILNFFGKIKNSLSHNNSFIPKHIIHKNNFKWEIYGKQGDNLFSDVSFSKKYNLGIKKNSNLIYFENFLLFYNNKDLKIKCICHKKNLKILNERFPRKNIVLLNDNTFLDYNNGKTLIYEIGTKANRLCEFYLSIQNIFHKKSEYNIQSIKDQISTCIFSFIFFQKKNSFSFIKPLNEKYSRFIEIDFFNSRFDNIYEVKFFGKKNYFLLSSANNSIEILSRKNFKIKKKFISDSIFLNFNVVGIILVGLDQNGIIFFWNINTCNLLTSFLIAKDKECVFTFFKIDNIKGRLFAGNKSKKIRAWNILLGRKSFPKPFYFFPKCNENFKINNLAVSKNNKILGISFNNKKVFLWKNDEDKFFMCLNNLLSLVWSLDFSPIDKTLVCGMGNGSIMNFNLVNGNLVKEFKSDGCPVICCKFNSDGLLLLGSFSDGKLKIWKVENAVCINTICNHSESLWSFDLSQKCQYIITSCSGGKIILLKDFGFIFCQQKKKQLKEFIKIQKYCDNIKSKKMFGYLFGKIIDMHDPTLLFDFTVFIFQNLKNGPTDLLVNVINDFQNKQHFFLLRCLILWNSKKSNFYLVQFILKLSLNSQSFLKFLTKQRNLLLNLISSVKKNKIDFLKMKKI